ncbi:hypothetical protein ACH5RR_013216 [Cinchona calisaya]|uniref:Uncharacterized protein n=1 Tax=Cinchona calisaya TaxID=153742 RepID=A0ABD2ZZG5_9GENT
MAPTKSNLKPLGIGPNDDDEEPDNILLDPANETNILEVTSTKHPNNTDSVLVAYQDTQHIDLTRNFNPVPNNNTTPNTNQITKPSMPHNHFLPIDSAPTTKPEPNTNLTTSLSMPYNSSFLSRPNQSQL